MSKFRKKPVVIEAVQFTEEISKDRALWPEGVIPLHDHQYPNDEPTPGIKTLEGNHNVSVGDWIITGVQGEKYPCKPDIFEATYDSVDEPVPGVREVVYKRDANWGEVFDLIHDRKSNLKSHSVDPNGTLIIEAPEGKKHIVGSGDRITLNEDGSLSVTKAK